MVNGMWITYLCSVLRKRTKPKRFALSDTYNNSRSVPKLTQLTEKFLPTYNQQFPRRI